MRSTKQFSVTLPKAHDKAIEQWLSGEASDIYDRMQAAPARARSSADVRASLAHAYIQTQFRPLMRASKAVTVLTIFYGGQDYESLLREG